MSKTDTKTDETTGAQTSTTGAETTATSTDLATRQASDLAVVDFGDDAGAGMETVTRDEFVIPFLRILQTNSPQVDGDAVLPGAAAGQIINLATNELFPGKPGVTFIPVHRDHNFVEFIPRNLGGGFVGALDEDEPRVLALRAEQGAFGKLYTSTKKTNDGLPAEGTEIGEQYYLYGLLVDEHGFSSRVMIAFGSTQIKKYKQLITRINSIRYIGAGGQPVTPPIWAHRWTLGTVQEQNKKGKFYGWSISLAAKNEDGTEQPTVKSLVKMSDPLYTEAKDFYELIKGGKVKADYAQTEGEAAGAGAEDKDEIPM